MTNEELQLESLKCQKWALALQVIGLLTTVTLILWTRDNDGIK